jgi:hypothetical protein
MICYQIFYYIYFTANTKTEEKQTRCLAVTGMILAISCGSTCQDVIFMIHISRHVLFSYGFLLQSAGLQKHFQQQCFSTLSSTS